MGIDQAVALIVFIAILGTGAWAVFTSDVWTAPDPHPFGWDRSARNYVLAAIYCSWCNRRYDDPVHDRTAWIRVPFYRRMAEDGVLSQDRPAPSSGAGE